MAVQKKYLYKVSRAGVFLGVLQNVTSDFGYTWNINTAAAELIIQVGQNPDQASETVPALETEAGAAIQTEAGDTIYLERTPDFVGDGNSMALIRGNNTVQVYEFSSDYPNGNLVFSGYISGWRANFGGTQVVEATVLSFGTELDNYVIQDTLTLDQSQATTNGSTILLEPSGASAAWERLGQSITVGAGVTNIAAINLNLAAVDANHPQVATVKLWNSVNDFFTGTALATATRTISSAVAADYRFTFGTAVATMATATPFFSVQASDSYGLSIATESGNTYPAGDGYESNYGGGSGGGAWTNVAKDLYFKTYSSSGATSVPFLSQDPSTMLTSIIDSYVSSGGTINYGAGTISVTGLTRSYTFKINTILEGIQKCLELAPADWFWYVDPATSTIYFKATPTTADHYLIKGRHLDNFIVDQTIENIKNIVYFSGGSTGSTNLFLKVTDATSLATDRVGLERISDNRVTLTDTATTLAQNVINNTNGPDYSCTVRVFDTTFDLTTLKPGDVIGFEGFGNFADSLLLQIASVKRSIEYTDLTLGKLRKRATQQVENIERQLNDIQTIDNPSVAS